MEERRGLKRVVVCRVAISREGRLPSTGELSLHFLFTFLRSSLWGGMDHMEELIV